MYKWRVFSVFVIDKHSAKEGLSVKNSRVGEALLNLRNGVRGLVTLSMIWNLLNSYYSYRFPIIEQLWKILVILKGECGKDDIP